MVPLPLAYKVRLRGGAAERVRGEQRGRQVLRARGADVRRDAGRGNAVQHAVEGAVGDERDAREEADGRDVHHERARRAAAAGGDGPQQVGLPLDHGGLGILVPDTLLRCFATGGQEQEEVDPKERSRST